MRSLLELLLSKGLFLPTRNPRWSTTRFVWLLLLSFAGIAELFGSPADFSYAKTIMMSLIALLLIFFTKLINDLVQFFNCDGSLLDKSNRSERWLLCFLNFSISLVFLVVFLAAVLKYYHMLGHWLGHNWHFFPNVLCENNNANEIANYCSTHCSKKTGPAPEKWYPHCYDIDKCSSYARSTINCWTFCGPKMAEVYDYNFSLWERWRVFFEPDLRTIREEQISAARKALEWDATRQKERASKLLDTYREEFIKYWGLGNLVIIGFLCFLVFIAFASFFRAIVYNRF